MRTKKIVGLVFVLLVVASTILSACATPTPETIIKTVEVEKEVEVIKTVEIIVEGETVVVTATPEPEVVEPTVIESLADVPEDVLAAVCEDVKAAVQYDDEARTLTLNLSAPFGPVMQLLSNGWASPIDQEWMVEQGAWDGDCATWLQFHDPSAEDSPIFNLENGTGPFRLEYWKPNEELSAVRWDGYWRTEAMWEGGPSGPAFYERVVEKTVDEWGTRFAMFQAGDLDSTYVPSSACTKIYPVLSASTSSSRWISPKSRPSSAVAIWTALEFPPTSCRT